MKNILDVCWFMTKEFPVWPIKYHTPSTGHFILLQPFVVAFGSLDDADM